MNILEKLQNDFRKNLKEGLDIVKGKSIVLSHKLEELTEEGKRKYGVFTLNMKMQEEFAKLGAHVYALSLKGSEDPFANKKVKSLLSKINKLETQIKNLEKKNATKTSPRSSRQERKSK
jgi:hypothetical protein